MNTSAPPDPRRWYVLGVLAAAQLMVVLDATIVNIALPSAQADLGFGDADRQWIITAYSLAFGSLLLLGGRLADLVGRKPTLLVGLVGFAVASAVGGAAEGFGLLVAARAVQGLFGALLAPAALSLLSTTFTEAKERAKAFAIFGTIAGGGAAVGLLLGGFLTEYLSWRWCMYVNLIFAAVALVGGLILIKHRPSKDRPRIDVPGIVTVTAGLVGIVYGFSLAETDGWGDSKTLGFLIGGVILVAVFVAIQTRSDHPLLPLRILADRNRSGAYLAVSLSAVGMFGVFLFLTYYLQATLGFSAVQTGVAFLPLVAALVISSTLIGGNLATRVGPRWIVGPGMVLGGLGLALFTRSTVDSSYTGTVLPGLIVFGAGMGLIFSSAMSMATVGVRREDSGVASALVNTGQQIGGSIGTALLNTIAASATTAFLTDGRGTQAEALVHSYVTVYWWAAAIFVAGGLISGAVLTSRVPVAVEQDVASAEPVLVH